MRVGIGKEEKEKKKLGQRGVQRARGGNRTGLVQGKKKPNRSSFYIRARGRFFSFFKSFFSLFSFSLFSLLLSEVPCGHEHSPARRPLAAPPCRSSSSPPPPLFFNLSNPLHSLVMNLRFVFKRRDTASLDLNLKRVESYPFLSCLVGLKRLWAGDW